MPENINHPNSRSTQSSKETELLSCIRENYSFFVNYARRHGNPSLAEDMVQEALLKAWRARESFKKDNARLTSWVIKILINHIKDERRASNVRPIIADEALDEFSYETLDHLDPQRSLELHETTCALMNGLAELDDTYRQAVLLRDVQGLHYDEIALELDIPMSRVKWAIFTGREHAAQKALQKVA